MDLVSVVVVSHSAGLAQAAREMALTMGAHGVTIETAGGGPGGLLGTDATSVADAIARAEAGQGVVVLGDLGSAIISIKAALKDGFPGQVRFADAPLVEGLIAAAVTASAGASLAEVAAAAEEARHAPKA